MLWRSDIEVFTMYENRSKIENPVCWNPIIYFAFDAFRVLSVFSSSSWLLVT